MGRKVCTKCQKRPQLFRYRGKIKRDKHHTLCQQCFRSVSDSNQARLAAEQGNQ